MRKLITNIWFWAFILLIIVNIAALSTMFVDMRNHRLQHEAGVFDNQPPGPRPPLSFSPDMQKKVGYNSTQMTQLKEIRSIHLDTMRNLKRDLHGMQRSLFIEISSNMPNADRIDEYKIQIAQIHSEIIDESIAFYENVRKISTPEQMEILNIYFSNSIFSPENFMKNRNGNRGFGQNKNNQ